MPSWKNDDKLSSVPSWLTEEDKRRCVRTNRGWELPLRGDGRTGGFELVVAMGQKGDPTRDTFGGLGATTVAQSDSPYFSYPDEMVSSGATAYTDSSTGATSIGANNESSGGYTNGAFFPFVAVFPDHVINDSNPGHFQGAPDADTSNVHLRFFVSLTAGGGTSITGSKSTQVEGITSCKISLIHFLGETNGADSGTVNGVVARARGASGAFSSVGVVGTTAGASTLPGGATQNAVGVVIQPAVGDVTDNSKEGFNPFVYIGAIAFNGTTGGAAGMTTYGGSGVGLSAWKGLTLNRES